MSKVKICGITTHRDLATVIDAGADAVGFVVDVPESPRNLSLGEAKALIDDTPIFIKTVAVTIPRSLDGLTKVYRRLRPDALQIHGGCLSDALIRRRLPNARFIRAVKAKRGAVEAAVEASKIFEAVIIDSFAPDREGGTGEAHDWELSRQVRQAIYPTPLILAGGLRPETVKEAIRIVQPYAVDVSSSVELRPGIKDPKKTLDFIRSVREAGRCEN